MEFRRIGNSGLRVSQVGLGGNNFGGRADAAASVKIINQALDMGINFIDTAESYNDGHSEELVGKAVKGKRDKVIIATKFGNPRSVGPDNQAGSRRYVMAAVEASLKRLDTDYIDLYYLHYHDVNTPIEETLRALNDIIRAGKARYIACSNFHAWELADAAWTAKSCNLNPFIAIQMKYNLLERSVEQEIVPCCVEHGVSVIPWGPLASGFLTGKYVRGKAAPAGTRFAAAPMSIYSDVMTEANWDKLEKLQAFAKERGHSVGELAIAWLLAHPWLGSVIAGAMNAAELKDNVAAANWKLTTDDIAKIDKMI
jgi:aryl-alcohol dehydrogenase-like predicted oxidoreductase